MQTDPTPHNASSTPHVFPTAPAYVRPVVHEGAPAYAIHDQHGKPLALAPTRELAFAYLSRENVDGVDAH